MAPWQVHKFGGTSVATADCIRRVAEIVHSQSDRVAVVVSAVGGKPKTTDLLLNTVKLAAEREPVEPIIQQIREKHEAILDDLFPNDTEDLKRIIETDLQSIQDILRTVSLMRWQATRISELISGYGELWSTQILTKLLQRRNPNFQYLDARKVVTVDEEAIQDGAIVWGESEAKLRALGEGQWVMTGYVASNTHGVPTTLQRDGSDYSAAILAKLLKAKSVTIWTDVDGILSADPRRVPLASVVPQVSFSEAMELAYFGAKVIHPKTMQPAIESQIPIFIRNTFHSSFPGTRIYHTSTTHADQVVCAFSSIEQMAIINVEGSGLIGVPGVAKRLFGTLEQGGVNVVLISQASSEHSITFATTEQQANVAKEVIEEEFRRELEQKRISNVDVKAPCSIIAAVGDGMSSTTGCAGRFFSALGDAKINIVAIAQGCSERNISAVVHSSESVRALRAVHAAFRLSHTTVRVGIIGMNEVGESLLKLLEDQRSILRSSFDLDLQVCVVLENDESNRLVCLKNDNDSLVDSVTFGAFQMVTDTSTKTTSFEDQHTTVKLESADANAIYKMLFRKTSTNHVIFDCTNSETIATFHAAWLQARIDVVTANNTGLSGCKEIRDEIHRAEDAFGKQSASYLREVTVGGGLPILKTLRSLLDCGDRIRRIDGILSVSLSFIFFRISPPTKFGSCSEFDQASSNGVFQGDFGIPAADIATSCTFSEAVRQAIDLGLMEEDPTKDLNNEYTSRVLMVLAQELGMSDTIELTDIQSSSETLLDVSSNYMSGELDATVQTRVDAARSRGCVLRHISSVDVQNKSAPLSIKIVEVPEQHIFAVTPPSCSCVRMFTKHHQSSPLIVQGPSAGADSTASALLASLLHRMRGRAGKTTITRSTSGAVLRC